jgi:hypothetical protein
MNFNLASISNTAAGAAALLLFVVAKAPAIELPYDHNNPVFYDNDGVVDTYTYHYVLALAAAGSIRLVGVSSSCSVQRPGITHDTYWHDVQWRDLQDLVATARHSDFGNLPDPVDGARESLVRPPSGDIDDTVPVDSPATRLMVREAKKATPGKPLVIMTGGQFTTVASAYLTDHSIVRNVIVVASAGKGTGGMDEYNGEMDPWASAIVLQKFRMVIFPYLDNFGDGARVTADLLRARLPATPFREQMIREANKQVGAPDGDPNQDQDGIAAYAIMAPAFAVSAKTVSFDRMFNNDGPQGRNHPLYHDDPNGNALVVTREDQAVADAEWWRAMSNPALYRR